MLLVHVACAYGGYVRVSSMRASSSARAMLGAICGTGRCGHVAMYDVGQVRCMSRVGAQGYDGAYVNASDGLCHVDMTMVGGR